MEGIGVVKLNENGVPLIKFIDGYGQGIALIYRYYISLYLGEMIFCAGLVFEAFLRLEVINTSTIEKLVVCREKVLRV